MLDTLARRPALRTTTHHARAGRSVLALAVALALCLGACGGEPPAPEWPRAEVRGDDVSYSALFPAKTQERKGPDGRAMAHLTWAIDDKGTRYEVALFRMPGPLTKDEKRALMQDIEAALGFVVDGTKAAGAEKKTVQRQDREETVLARPLPGNKTGEWHIFFDTDERLFQVSVVGPETPKSAAQRAKFFASFTLERGKKPNR